MLGAAGGTVLPAAGAAYRAGQERGQQHDARPAAASAPAPCCAKRWGPKPTAWRRPPKRATGARKFQPRAVRDIPETLAEASGSSTAARVESRPGASGDSGRRVG